MVKREVGSVCAEISEWQPSDWRVLDGDQAARKDGRGRPRARLECSPGKIISAIGFASFGTPRGVCGNFSLGSCHARRSYDAFNVVRSSLSSFFFLGVLITIDIVIITSEFKTMIIIILVPHYHRYNDHYLHILFSVIIAYYHHLSHLNLCIRCRHHHPGHLNLFTPCHHHHLPLRLIFCVRVYHHRPYLFFSRLFCRKSHSFYTGVEQNCVGQQRCSVVVAAEVFGGDPCPGIMKRLAVEAICS